MEEKQITSLSPASTYDRQFRRFHYFKNKAMS